MWKWIWLELGLLVLAACPSYAAVVTKVGNGDDGTDLEEVSPLSEGPIVLARAETIRLLEKLNVVGIAGLGLLLPDVSSTELYLVTSDSRAILTSDQGNFHADLSGRVYARTLAHPHAPTRFYPIALTLSIEQLVSLHLHEALHRALSSEIRENEGIVSQITLAMTSPGATYDQVAQTMEGLTPKRSSPHMFLPGDPTLGSTAGGFTERQSDHPSNVGLGFRQFFGSSPNFGVHRMYLLHSDLYPLAGPRSPLGFGIEGTLLATEKGNYVGPLGLSARYRAISSNDFDLGVWANVAFNTISSDDFKNSPFGRDVYTFGLSMRKSFEPFYVENFLGFCPAGQSGNSPDLLFFYGNTLNAKIRGGYRLGQFDLGAFVELHLGDYRVLNNGVSRDYGRFHILSLGPELAFVSGNISVGLSGRMIVNSNQGATFDYLGNLLGAGIAQGGIGLSVSMGF
jgi:hypothetical protein